MATTVRITETYDLKTTVNKLGIIGIHTPSESLIKKLYPGLLKNHKYMRLQKCDVTGVCASVLPADPLQVGVASGDVAPEDMFNPILYKPVSNDSFETIQNRMYQGGNMAGMQGSLIEDKNTSAPFDIYYSLLSEAKKWKKAMPQNGFALRGLYPICYQVINTYGNQNRLVPSISASGQLRDIPKVDADLAYDSVTGPWVQDGVAFRGKSVKMPKFPIHVQPEENGHTYNGKLFAEVGEFFIPKTFVAMFIIPPARLHEFYYRMRVSWTITFSGVMSTLDSGTKSSYQDVAPWTHAMDFSYESSKTTPLENKNELVDTDSVTINKIMES